MAVSQCLKRTGKDKKKQRRKEQERQRRMTVSQSLRRGKKEREEGKRRKRETEKNAVSQACASVTFDTSAGAAQNDHVAAGEGNLCPSQRGRHSKRGTKTERRPNHDLDAKMNLKCIILDDYVKVREKSPDTV